MDRERQAQLAGGLASGRTIEEIASFFGWTEAVREEATVEAARMADEAELAAERTRLVEHMASFKIDGEKYRVVARVELNAKTTTTAPSGNGNGKAESIVVDGVAYVSAAAARDTLLPGKKGTAMSRKAIVSALKTAKHAVG